jgi:ABC-2 type transport system ATP-binding protein
MSIAISVEDLVKSYGDNTVIKGISFSVNEGEIFALLGVNGAGKTTTLECIEGLRKYESGSIKVNGTMGVQLQSSSLPSNIKPREALRLFSKWNNSSLDEELLKSFNIPDIEKKQYHELSTGQKRRLHLALALISDPDIIFLDEPTAGLDVEGRVSLHDEIRKLKKSGKTIIMASHDMAEVESLCDRIAILKDGKIAFIGTANELTREFGQYSMIHIKTLNPIDVNELENSVYEGMDKDYAVFMAENIEDALLELMGLIKQSSNKVVDIKVEKATLEERFIDIAREGK